MDGVPAGLLHAWHDFYAIIGTAAATLLGAMFVVASILAIYSKRSEEGVQAFYTPTTVHLTAALAVCLALSAPSLASPGVAALLLVIGAAGLGYSLLVWLRMGRRGFTAMIDLADRIWYALSPMAGYLGIVAAAIALLLGNAFGLEVLAVAVVLLLAASIRNAWDITIWMVIRAGR
jgi:hypothetical protein